MNEIRSRLDPRWYQIAALGWLLTYGLVALDFDQPLSHAAGILLTALLTQIVCSELAGLPRIEPKSALISALSLCLLCRTNSYALALAAAAVTIASKFIFRWSGKHIFNPTNFGLVAMMLLTDGRVWVSPAQWGNVAFFGFLIACLGSLVVTRARRADVTLAFLGFYGAILFGRALWLGQPMAIPLHMLQSGALLLFAFFMISDPKTTPDSRRGRILFVLLVALGAGFVQFVLYRTNGLLWSLAAFSFATPLLDWLLPAERYDWNKTLKPVSQQETKGKTHEETVHPADVGVCVAGK